MKSTTCNKQEDLKAYYQSHNAFMYEAIKRGWRLMNALTNATRVCCVFVPLLYKSTISTLLFLELLDSATLEWGQSYVNLSLFKLKPKKRNIYFNLYRQLSYIKAISSTMQQKWLLQGKACVQLFFCFLGIKLLGGRGVFLPLHAWDACLFQSPPSIPSVYNVHAHAINNYPF